MFPMPDLDPRSTVPLYRQLYDYIGELVRTGKLARGEKLPATRELAGSLGLNRATVGAAYELLEGEGLISSHVGRGSFVAGVAAAERRPPDWKSLLARPEGFLPVPALPVSEESISFAASRPAERLFPMQEFRAACHEVMAQAHLNGILQLGSTAGYEPLRAHLWEAAREEGSGRPGDGLMVTSGCQQG